MGWEISLKSYDKKESLEVNKKEDTQKRNAHNNRPVRNCLPLNIFIGGGSQ